MTDEDDPLDGADVGREGPSLLAIALSLVTALVVAAGVLTIANFAMGRGLNALDYAAIFVFTGVAISGLELYKSRQRARENNP